MYDSGFDGMFNALVNNTVGIGQHGLAKPIAEEEMIMEADNSTNTAMTNIDDLTIAQLRQLAQEALDRRNVDIEAVSVQIPAEDAKHPYTIGSNIIVRMVTTIITGRLVWVGDHELVLEDPAWIADTGRWNQVISGDHEVLEEVEPGDGPVIIGRGAILDVWPWIGLLPRDVR